MAHFGERLHQLRQTRGLTMYRVGKETGLSQQLIRRLEGLRSGAQVRGLTLFRLARFYGVTIDELLGIPDDDDDAQAA